MTVIGSLGELVYDIVANDKTQTGTKNAGKSLAAVGVAMTGLGASMALLDSAGREFDANMGGIAENMGVNRQAIEDMALSMSDSSTSISEVADTFKELSDAGIKTTADMDTAASGFFVLADASGVAANELVDELTPAFNAFDIPLTEISDHMDTVTWVMKNSTLTMSEYTTLLDKTATSASELGYNLEDTSAIIEILSQHGITGKAAYSKMSDAAKNAAPDIQDMADKSAQAAEDNSYLNDELAIANMRLQKLKAAHGDNSIAIASEELSIKKLTDRQNDNNKTIGEYNTALANSKTPQENYLANLGITDQELKDAKASQAEFNGKTKEFADIANEKHGIIDEFKSEWEKIAVGLGKSVEPLEPITAGLITMGPAIAGVGGGLQAINAMGGISGALGTSMFLGVLGAVLVGWALVTNVVADYADRAGYSKDITNQLRSSWLDLLGPIGMVYNSIKGVTDLLDKYGGWQGTLNQIQSKAGQYISNPGSYLSDLGNYISGNPISQSNKDPATGLPYGNMKGRASGGPVSSGETYLVGENGPEYLTMGRNSGNITPNGAGSTTIINIDGRFMAKIVAPYMGTVKANVGAVR